MRILVICPSIYPEKYNKMKESLFLTKSKYTDIHSISSGTVTEAINKSFQLNHDYDFYFIANDDIIFNTPLWDLRLARKGKITYGNDGIQGKGLCTFPMIDGNIVRTLGWLQLPTLNRYCGDIVWKYIGEQCKCLEYMDDVCITHKWEGCADSDMNKKDMQEFANWLPWSFKDIARVKEVL